MIILVLIGTVFVIIWDMIYWRISLNLVLLLLLMNFASGFKLELMYLSLIVSIRLSLTHLHSFQLLVLLPLLVDITFFVCNNKMNPLNLKYSSEIMVKDFLKMPNLHMLIKWKGLSLTRKMTLRTFGELLIMISTKVYMLYLFYSTAWRCCLLHLMKQNCLWKTFSMNSNLDDSGISLPAFSSRTHLKLHKFFITPKLVKKVKTNLDLVLTVFQWWFERNVNQNFHTY